MGFRERLSALIDPAKAKDADAIFDELDNTLDGYGKDIKTLKAEIRSKDGIKPEDFAALEQENAALKGKLNDSEKARKKAETELATASETVGKKSAALQNRIRGEELTKNLVTAKVKPEFLDAAKALLSGLVQVDEETGEAFVVDKASGKEVRVGLADHIKSWAGSDAGKPFVSAPISSGGGSTGGYSMPAGVDFAKMSPLQMNDYARKGTAERAQVTDYLAHNVPGAKKE